MSSVFNFKFLVIGSISACKTSHQTIDHFSQTVLLSISTKVSSFSKRTILSHSSTKYFVIAALPGQISNIVVYQLSEIYFLT